MAAKWMFKLHGDLTAQQRLILGFIGFSVLIAIWFLVTMGEDPMVKSGILPAPLKVLSAYGDLCRDNALIQNTFFSIGLNLAGYTKAIIISLVAGFVIGLYPLFRGLFQSQVDAIRFVPLTAVTSLFIVWFGIGSGMKVNFLAFGILIYLLPVVVQRIDEVKDVYLKTVYTLGATDWQTIRTVYIPSVMSRLFDDIRILTAISWTYIIVAEMIASQGGVGSLLFSAGRRQGRVDKIFAILGLIILIGILQDKIFKKLDKEFFPHKYQTKKKYSTELQEPSLLDNIFDFGFTALVWVALGVYLIMMVAEFVPSILGGLQPLSHLFQDTVWVVHFLFLCIVFYKGRNLYMKKKYAYPVPVKVSTDG